MANQGVIDAHLEELHERAVASFEKGNRMAACYLACLCGMWTHGLYQPYKNRFEQDDNLLYSWFRTGFDCSNQAKGMSDKIRMEQLKKEGKQDAKRLAAQLKIAEATSGEPKGSFFKIKLW